MDYKIVIDPGHGGTDSGASGNGIIEKDLNLEISKYMYDRFNELGIPVKLTRSTDETITPTERANKILDAYGNNSNVIVISNHINAGGGEGAEVIYALRNNSTLADKVLMELGNEGQVMRKTYQRRLPSDTSKDYYFIHRDTGRTQPIIVEYGFLDSNADAERLKNNYRNYAEAVVRAVVQYLNADYTPSVGTNTYTVEKGDSLWSISKKFGVTTEDIKNANNLKSNLLTIGQKLIIPSIIEEKDYLIYTVQKGDTLYSIAKKYGFNVDEIINYNNLDNTSLSIGEQILIPNVEEEADYITHIVKSGDNLYNIATTYNTTVNEIKTLNNLSSNLLSINQKLLIPKTETPTINDNYTTYIVQLGDSLWSISKKFNTTTDTIKDYNNLTTNLLSIGQQLKIPTTESSNTYTVKSGDNLYAIARKFNTTVDEIKRKNNLSSNVLSIGQILII